MRLAPLRGRRTDSDGRGSLHDERFLLAPSERLVAEDTAHALIALPAPPFFAAIRWLGQFDSTASVIRAIEDIIILEYSYEPVDPTLW